MGGAVGGGDGGDDGDAEHRCVRDGLARDVVSSFGPGAKATCS